MTTVIQLTTFKQTDSIDFVEWIDTDVSEDEDYLPRFPRNKYIAPLVQCCQIDQKINAGSCTETTTELNSINHWDVNYTKVTEIIDKVIDNGLETVDLSNLELSNIPFEIKELGYATVIRNGVVKPASLKLFLFNNQLKSLNPILFTLRNLTVLSLRIKYRLFNLLNLTNYTCSGQNRLVTLPPEIALLENLSELSIGNNQLKYIPAELLRLKKLKLLTLLPNPYLSGDNAQRLRSSIASLKEISIRRILAYKLALSSKVPTDLVDEIQSVSAANQCEQCHTQFYEPDIQEIRSRTVFGYPNIPVLFRLCSTTCLLKLHE